MNQPVLVELPKVLLLTLNQLFDMERKISLHGDSAGVLRNVERLKDAFAEELLFYEDPTGQPFNETRSDLEASIAGASSENLFVAEVVKPVIRHGDKTYSRVVQKGIVVVQSKDAKPADAGEQGSAQ